MKNLALSLICLALALSCSSKNSQTNNNTDMVKNYLFLLGTYTQNEGEGINIVEFKPEQDQFDILDVASDVENPSFLIANDSENLVFSVEETGGSEGGKLTSFRFDRDKKTLKKINSVFTQGGSPCYISLDPSESFLVVSNYSGGNITAIPVDREGNLSEEIQLIQHTGSSINPGRQKQPHVHSAVFHPKENKVFVADLGTDKIYVYNFDKTSPTPLSPADPASFPVKPGSGPRHLLFNQGGDVIYLIHEITAEIGVYLYNDGKISHLETHTLLPEGFTGEVGAAEVRISPDGNFLYASNRGEANDINAFKIDKKDGSLSKIQYISSGGIAPRNFAITPDGDYLICGNQDSDKLVVFNRNKEDGTLSLDNLTLSVNKPVYLYFLE